MINESEVAIAPYVRKPFMLTEKKINKKEILEAVQQQVQPQEQLQQEPQEAPAPEPGVETMGKVQSFLKDKLNRLEGIQENGIFHTKQKWLGSKDFKPKRTGDKDLKHNGIEGGLDGPKNVIKNQMRDVAGTNNQNHNNKRASLFESSFGRVQAHSKSLMNSVSPAVREKKKQVENNQKSRNVNSSMSRNYFDQTRMKSLNKKPGILRNEIDDLGKALQNGDKNAKKSLSEKLRYRSSL